MKSHWRKLAAMFPLPLEKKIYRLHFETLHNQWEKGDRSFPPSHLAKQQLIKRYAAKGNHSILVETGTYLGDMIFAMQDVFQQIYSIELSSLFYEKARKRFEKYKHISIINGDSGKVLKDLAPALQKPALFWLDGHYSGGQTAKGEKECPIYEELASILQPGLAHTIVIDDARLFIGANDYPTIDELKQFVATIKTDCHFHFENDAVIITFN